MKKFINALKIGFTLVFISYVLVVLYFLFFSLKKKRFHFAEMGQGLYLSQTIFDILILQYPDYSDAYFEKSVAFNKTGDYAKGFKLLNVAVDKEAKLHLGYRGWMKLRKLRDFEGALVDFSKLDSLTPNVIDAPWGENIDFLRGECYFGKKDYLEAIKLFERNIETQTVDWADIYSFEYIGLCYYQLGSYDKSVEAYKRALIQSENFPEVYFGLAKAYLKLGEVKKSKENILKAEKYISYKRDDIYNEFLNEIYLFEILDFKVELNDKSFY